VPDAIFRLRVFDADQGAAGAGLIALGAMKSLLAVAAVIAPVSAWAAETSAEPYTWEHHMMWGAGWYGMIFGPVFMILVLAVVIAVAVLIVRWLGGPWYGAPPHYPPQAARRSTSLKSASHEAR